MTNTDIAAQILRKFLPLNDEDEGYWCLIPHSDGSYSLTIDSNQDITPEEADYIKNLT